MLQISQYIYCPGKKLPLKEFVVEYRKLCQEADDLFSEFNPCDIHDAACYRGRHNDNNANANFCCGNCEYLTETGCKAEALKCKIWVCGAIVLSSGLTYEFKTQLAALGKKVNLLCRHFGYRKDLPDYIMHFYGKKGYRKWLVEETKLKSNSISSSSES